MLTNEVTVGSEGYVCAPRFYGSSKPAQGINMPLFRGGNWSNYCSCHVAHFHTVWKWEKAGVQFFACERRGCMFDWRQVRQRTNVFLWGVKLGELPFPCQLGIDSSLWWDLQNKRAPVRPSRHWGTKKCNYVHVDADCADVFEVC